MFTFDAIQTNSKQHKYKYKFESVCGRVSERVQSCMILDGQKYTNVVVTNFELIFHFNVVLITCARLSLNNLYQLTIWVLYDFLHFSKIQCPKDCQFTATILGILCHLKQIFNLKYINNKRKRKFKFLPLE